MHNYPIIGITTDFQEKANCYSKYPWFALRKHYTHCIEKFGCTPIILPITKSVKNIDFLDGLLISGGDFDIDPFFYGQKINSDRVQTSPDRTDFEIELIDRFFSQNKPILGICGGCQLINIYLQGSLIQHIQTDINHEQVNPRNETSHEIILNKGSFLEKYKSSGKIYVNSAHHQAVDKLGNHLKIDASAPDGIIEAFHHESHPYCVGLQWHPEFLITDFDKKTIKGFVDNVKKNFK